jgi:RNA polymerase sigma-70 factor, ECF subfamily
MQGYFAMDDIGRRKSVAYPSSLLEPGCATETRRAESATHTLESSWSKLTGSRRKQTSDQDDLALVERLQAGDHQALEAIIDLYSPKLYNVAQRILGERADTEEVIQDVFWTVFRKAKTFQGGSRFSTWLYRLTVNEALGKIRRRKNQKREIEYKEYLPKFADDGHHRVRPVVDWSDNLDRSYARQEMQRVVKAALDELKPLDRSVVVLSDLEGLTDKEIAATLQLTISAVKTRLHRARLFLRGNLATYFGHSAV